MSEELHRPVRIDRIGPSGLTLMVVASPAESVALARRMQISGVVSLECDFRLRAAPNDAFAAAGHLRARVVQTCVVTLEDFEADLEEKFTLRFVRAGTEAETIDLESDDELPYEGDAIDLGEAAAEQLALSLDPYPRAPGAELPSEASDEDDNPFSALKGLQS